MKSVLYHFDRQDFKKWIKGTIGDTILVNKIIEIGKSVEREEFKNEIHRTVKQRFFQLKKFLASQDARARHNLGRFQELLLKISRQKKFHLTLWVVGEETHWGVEKDLDLLEKADLITGKMGYSDQSGYREYTLTDKGNRLVHELLNQR